MQKIEKAEIRKVARCLRGLVKYIDEKKAKNKIVQIYMMLLSLKPYYTTSEIVVLRNNMSYLQEPQVKGILILANKKAQNNGERYNKHNMVEILKIAKEITFY
jgi:hypothetical protein